MEERMRTQLLDLPLCLASLTSVQRGEIFFATL